MNIEDGKKFVDDIVAQAEASRDELTKKIEETTEKLVDKMGLVRQKDVDAMKERITELEAELKKVKGN